MWEHLHACSRCFDAYQDSAVLQGTWKTDEIAFEPARGLVDIGVQVASGGTARESGARSQRRPGFVRPRFGFATACAVFVLVAAVWWLWPDRIDRAHDAGFDAAVLAPIRTAVETASRWGPFVFPGGERSLDANGPAFRSGFIPLSDSLEASLSSLHAAFQGGNASPELATWLVSGLVVTGHIDAARDLVSHPRLTDLTDPRMTVLGAIVAYMDKNYDESEALLRSVLDKDPDDPVASINLAIVLDEQDNREEACAILTRVSRVHAGTPLARRAKSLLSDIQTHRP